MERAVEAFADLHSRYGNDPGVAALHLYIVCHSNKASETRLLNHARKVGLNDKIFLTGFVDDRKLVELYQKARCLFFPSLYEGFGLPLLEGLACGLPVAASNTSSLPEVGGELSVYFDPYVVSEMADSIYQALQLPNDYESRVKRFEYASRFSWKGTALGTLKAFADLDAADVPDEKSDTTPDRGDFIDVRQRMSEVSVEELCETAESFFARIDDWDYLHAKPFAAVAETPELLTSFAQVVHGLSLLPDMTILDFGAGSCWTSRFLSQLGMRVIAVDVSSSALKIGEALYNRFPPVGDQPEPTFLQFNGHDLDLPPESVDRISCWDAFHHVPNPAHVLREMARVLKSGGIAGFSEPGPEHSKTPQSQYEMRTNQLIENDIVMSEIWFAAQAAGFTDIKLAMFNPKPTLVPLERFEAYLNGADGEDYLAETRQEMQHRRLFFLYKGESQTPMDSRQRDGLRAELNVQLSADTIAVDGSVSLNVIVQNTGTSIWLPAEARIGAVRFGIHLFDENGKLLDLDYFRHSLTGDQPRPIAPGETIEFVVGVPMTSRGAFILECDLVSEGICWFEHNGSPTVRLKILVT
jgi:SAM-dependent methyltransferase